MKIINWKAVSIVLVVVTAVVFIVKWFLGDKELSFRYIIDSIELSVTVIGAIAAVFVSCLWKWKMFQGWLVKIPNLSGEWTGNLYSDWVNPETGEKIAPIDATLKIKQSLIHTSCVMKTKEMVSYSNCSTFYIDEEKQIKQLIYTYISSPHQNIQQRSAMHQGTTVVYLDDNYDVTKLSGDYYTGRNTTGHMEFERN